MIGIMRGACHAFAVSASLLVGASTAQAAAVFSFSEVGGAVVGVLSGSVNVAGLTTGTTPSYGPRIGPVVDELVATPCVTFTTCYGNYYTLAPGFPSKFGNTFETIATSATGDDFEIQQGEVILPEGYSGGALSNTITFAGQTFASLGVTPGNYVYTLPGAGDTITLSFIATPAPVPEPATWAMFIGGLGIAGSALRRRHLSPSLA